VSTPTDGSGETDSRHPRILDYLSSSLSASNREKNVESGELFSQNVPRKLNQPLREARLRGVFLHNDGTSSGKRRRDITTQNPKSKREIACSKNGDGPQRDEAPDQLWTAGRRRSLHCLIDFSREEGPLGESFRKHSELKHRSGDLAY
jgi:hypothetical protein